MRLRHYAAYFLFGAMLSGCTSPTSPSANPTGQTRGTDVILYGEARAMSRADALLLDAASSSAQNVVWSEKCAASRVMPRNPNCGR